MKRTILSLLLLVGLSMFNGLCSMLFAQNDAMYIYRNDGVINAFLKADIDSIRHSTLDLDSVLHAENVTQEVWTVDSVYRIPLSVIDSVSFVTPPTVYKEGVKRLEYNLLNYIIGADGFTLKLKPNTPTMIVPVKGDKLVLLEGCDVLPYGFSGIVSRVEQGSSSIDVVCEQAYLEDLFDSYCSVSTVYGYSPDSLSANSPGIRRRVTYNPDDIVFSLGPYKISKSYEVSQGLVFDGDLALKGGASFSTEIQPTFRIHTFLMMSLIDGVYFNSSITGDLRVTTQASLYGGLDYNHDFDGLVIPFPIPMTANLINFYVNPGLFLRADATISSTITSTQVYNFNTHFSYYDNMEFSLGGQLVSSSTDMVGSLDGSVAGGAYIETGFNLKSRKIAKVCVRGEFGGRLSGSFVLRNSDLENAMSETLLYERLKASNVEFGSFANASVQASVLNTVGSKTWELYKPIYTWDLVPTFSNTKLTYTQGSNTSLNANTELRGNCLFPVGVGFKLLDEYKYEVRDYNANSSFTSNACKLEHTFSGLNDDRIKLGNYKVYPKVKLFGHDILASPSAEVGFLTCPDDHHPHAIDLGLPSGTKWCCCNVGASTPEGYGGYYAWGETSEKSYYTWESYAYYNPNTGRVNNIGSDIAGTSYDVARVRMGAPWRMPSLAQQQELISNCSRQWTQQNGVNGILVTGKNGGQIFLPAAGYRWNDNLDNAGGNGNYWSSSLYPNFGNYAYLLDFGSGYWFWSGPARRYGRSVRAVCP